MVRNYFFVTKRHSQASDIIVTGVTIYQLVLVDVSSVFIKACGSKRKFFEAVIVE